MNILVSILAGIGTACILVALTGFICLLWQVRRKPAIQKPLARIQAVQEAEDIILALL